MPDASHYVPDDEGPPEIRAIIEGFRRPGYTVAKMMEDGFTHVTGTCTSCGATGHEPVSRMMLEARMIHRTNRSFKQA
jgi:hypothetical protein